MSNLSSTINWDIYLKFFKIFLWKKKSNQARLINAVYTASYITKEYNKKKF